MTAIPYSFFCYHLTQIDVKWRPEDHRARIMVKGLKQEEFNGYIRVKINNQARDFSKHNIEEFVKILMQTVGRRLAEEIKGPISIVPIPNSGMAVGAKGPFRIVELAGMVAQAYGPNAEVIPAIRWDKPRNKSHKIKGYRHPDHYQPFMRLSERPRNRVVLFDDVLTSGSQMIAAARFLSEEEIYATRAIVVARATPEQHENPIKWRTDELVIAEGDFDFDAEF